MATTPAAAMASNSPVIASTMIRHGRLLLPAGRAMVVTPSVRRRASPTSSQTVVRVPTLRYALPYENVVDRGRAGGRPYDRARPVRPRPPGAARRDRRGWPARRPHRADRPGAARYPPARDR